MCEVKEEAGTKIDRLTAAMNRLSDGVEALVAQARKPHGEGHTGRFAGETGSAVVKNHHADSTALSRGAGFVEDKGS